MGCLCLSHHQERYLHGPQCGRQLSSKSILTSASHTSACSASRSLDFSRSSLQEDYRMPRSSWLGLKTWDVSKDSVCCYEVFIWNISNQQQCASLCIKRCFHSQTALLHAWLRDLGSFSMVYGSHLHNQPQTLHNLQFSISRMSAGDNDWEYYGLDREWQPSLALNFIS